MVDFAPPLIRGAIVQLIQDMGFVLPNIVSFQYNPEKVTRAFKPWNPFDADATKRTATATQAAPFDPEETYQFTLEFDATNDIELYNPIAMATGVASRIAAVQKLVMPTAGLIGDLVGAAKALAAKGSPAMTEVKKVPLCLFVMGPGLILPVRVTSLSIEVKEFNSMLYPLMADVTLDLRVLTPDAFRCKNSVANDFAKSAYEFTRLQEDALAIANMANALLDARSMLPLTF